VTTRRQPDPQPPALTGGFALRLEQLPARQAEPRDRTVVAQATLVRETVATNLRSARQRAGLSQSALAEHAGVDKRTISRIERARVDTVVPKLYALAVALSIPLADLLAGLPET
jgi:ribosome-binding protein aMBF1 (putative translation factor)